MSTICRRTGNLTRWAPLCLLTLALPACEQGGNFTILGYSSRPNYNEHIHTVYVPIFKNQTYERALEYELTQAVIREIESKTPYKVTSNRESADTELLGNIVGVTKNILNRNQLNEVREAEMVITAQITWRDLRTGELLSQPRKAGDPAPLYLPPPGSTPGGAPLQSAVTSAPTQPLQMAMAAADNKPEGSDGDTLPPPTPLPGSGALPPGAIPAPGLPPPPPPFVTVQSNSNFVPEIGGSPTSALNTGVQSLAVQIVDMMEKPW